MLLFIILLAAFCSIVYELLLSATASYLLGNSIVQFSLTIGFFLFGLGLGAQLAKHIKNLEKSFFYIEIFLAILGSFSVLIVKWAYIYFYNYELFFQIFYISIVTLIGILTGFEIPLISTIIDKKNKNIQNTVGDVFSWDYIGSLIGTLLFPFILLPWLGITFTAFVVGILNLIIALLFLIYLNTQERKNRFKEMGLILVSFFIIGFGGILANTKLESLWDHFFYKEPILYSKHSQYQKIVITKRGDDIRLYLNGHLQFLSLDENRYHTSLTFFGKKLINNFTGNNLKILVLGGGDGLAVRNLIYYLSGKNFSWNITLVDLDPQITNLTKTHPILTKLNQNSLNHPNVKVINQDAFKFLEKDKNKYNIIIADFPDPRNIEISKLYSKEFYYLVKNHLANKAIFTTQASSAFFSKEAFWSIYKTIQELQINYLKDFQKIKLENNKYYYSKFLVIPYHSYIPSFGDWGFVSLLKNIDYKPNSIALSGLIQFKFDNDYLVNFEKIKINTLDKPNIIKYYIIGRKRYNQ